MIERYTNRSGNINLQATYIREGNSTPTYGSETLSVDSNTQTLIKFNGIDLTKFSKIGKVVLRLIVSQEPLDINDSTRKTQFYVHRNIEDFNPETVVWSNKPARNLDFDGGALIPRTFYDVGETDLKYTMIELDLTSIFNYWKKYGVHFHGITITKSSGSMSILRLSSYITEGLRDYFILEDSKLDGLAPHLSHTPTDCGFGGKVYVNDLTGKLVHQLSGFQTESKLMPIGLTGFKSSKNLDGLGMTNLMGTKYRASFEYAFKVLTDRAVMVHPNGSESIFMKMTKEEAIKYGINTQVDIVYVDLSSYAYATSSGTVITVRYQDGSKIEFNLSKMISLTSADYDVINYHWVNNQLDYITNNEGQRVNLSYDASGRIIEVEFVEEKRLLEITYDASDNIINAKFHKWVIDPSTSQGDRIYTELESASYQKTTTLFTVIDDKTNDRIEFVLSNEVVTAVYIKKHATNTIMDKLTFTRDGEETIIENFINQKQYLNFDNYGQLTHRLDEFGNSLKVEYDLVGKDGTSRKVSSKSEIQSNKGNMINDPSFDAQVGEYHTDTQGWKKNTNTNNVVKSFDDGVFGNQCLMVRKFGSGATSVFQEIPVSPGVYKFIGFEKRIGISGNPTIRAIATYTIQRLAQGSEVGVLDSSGNAWVSDTVSTSSTTAGLSGTTDRWQKFELSITIPTGALFCTIKLEISATHTAGDLLVDDFQLSQSEQAVNYNLIPNGYFEKDDSTIPTGWNHDNLSAQDILIINELEQPYTSFIGNRKMRFIGDFTKTKKLFKAFDIFGSAGDEFLLSGWFEGKITASEEAFMKAIVLYDTKPSETFSFTLNPNEGGWQNITKGFVAKDAYHSIEIIIEHRGIFELCFDALQLYLNSASTHYQYDDMGNMMDYMKSKSSSETVRNTSGDVLMSSNDQGETHRYAYDLKKQLTLVKDNKGNQVKNTYDSKGNQTKMELESTLGKITHEMTFNTKNQLTKIKDEFGLETNYVYDTEHRSSEIINPLGHKDKSEYNQFDQLIKIIKESSTGTNENLNYVYDSVRNLKKIIVDASTYYEFFYDVFNQVTEVKINNYTIVKYEYNSKHQMTKQTYGSLGDYYEFAYDDKERLATVKLNGVEGSLCTYTYDDFDRIAKVSYLGVTTYYSYDRSGKLIRKTDSAGQSERFVYDNIDAIQKSIININGMVRSFENIMPYETSQYNFDGFMKRLDKAYDDDHILFDSSYNGQTGIKSFYSSDTAREDDSVLHVPILNFGENTAEARYQISSANTRRISSSADGVEFNYQTWKSAFDHKKTVYGWFKLELTSIYDQDIFRLARDNYQNTIRLGIQPNGQLKVFVNGQNFTVPINQFVYTANTWVFLAMQIETVGSNVLITLTANEQKILEQSVSIQRIPELSGYCLVSDFAKLIVGLYMPDPYPVPTSPFKVAHLVVGAYDYDQAELEMIYNLALPYFQASSVPRKQRSGILYHDHEAYEGLDVVTLKGTLVSEKGIQPDSYGYQAASFKLDKSKLFEYDDIRNIHVYGSYDDIKDLGLNKSKLVYDLNLKNQGTISLRFKPKMVGSELRTILSLQKGTETPLGLYVNSANQLCLTLNQFESLGLTVNHDAWNHLVISWDDTELAIHLNNNQVIPKTKSASFDQSKLAIGSLINSLEPTYHFNGQFEMLAYSDHPINTTKATLLINSYQTVSVESVYDYIGRKEKEEITIGTQKLETSMTYKSPGLDKTSMQVESIETYTGEVINYQYDVLGNVIHMETNDGIYDYEYDYMGRLILEYNPVLNQTIKIEYNKQNIAYKRYYVGKTQVVYQEMEFLTNHENQLLFVDTVKDANVVSIPLTYPSSYLGNPTMIGSKTLSWEGRRLKQITEGTSVSSYDYNEQGIRTKKDIDGVVTTYNLKGSNVIAETKNGITTFFIYNEQDELVGFEYNNKQYFYVRDLLGKITEVIDKSGVVMVSYKYDAWGNWINKGSASNGTSLGDTLVVVNPFIYKGYYYDVETDWYYLKSRYYSPLLSRFISMDNTSYLEPGSIDGVNLFAYCYNNPVMMVDSEGNLPRWLKATLIVAAAILVVVAVTALVVLSAGTLAVALGAGLGTVLTITSGAAVGGLVFGGISIVGQGIGKGFDNIDLFSVAIDTFTGSAYGAISGIAGPGAGLVTKVGIGFGKVGLSMISAGLHGINDGLDGTQIWKNIGKSAAISSILQVGFIGSSYISFGGGSSSAFISRIMSNSAIRFLKDKMIYVLENPTLKSSMILGLTGMWNLIVGKYS